MDPKFSHDLHKRPRTHELSNLNTPEWAKYYSGNLPNSRVRRYTTPNPIPSGINISVERVIEMPPYDKNFLDKDTVWSTPLFPVIVDESESPERGNGNGGSSVRVRNTRFGGAGSGSEVISFPPCLSYESLLESGQGPAESRRWPTKDNIVKPQWHYKDLRPVFNQR